MTNPAHHAGDGAPATPSRLRLVTETGGTPTHPVPHGSATGGPSADDPALGDPATGASDGLAGITVNRDPHGVDPFAPILTTPTFSAHSGTPSGYAVELEDASEPTGYRHVGSVSPTYLLLPNAEVRALALEVAAQTHQPYRESGLFWDGKRMMHTVDLLGHTEAVVPGDEHALRLVTMTSYDKSWRYRCMLGVVRFQCSNGTVAGDWFASVDFKHVAAPGTPRAESWRAVVRQAMAVVDEGPEALDRFVGAMRTLKAMRTTDGRLREVWGGLGSLPDVVKGRIVSHYVEHEPEANLYALYQAGTAVLSKRSERATSADVGHLDAFCSAMLQLAERG